MTDFHLDRFHQMPLAGAAMTPFPHFVSPDDPVDLVEELMSRYDIRHIPVHDGGEPVGVISERELAGCGAGATAEDVMATHPCVVGIGAPLNEVLREMADRRSGAALVVRKGKLAGILSVTDACRILAEVLEDRYPGDGDDAA